MQFNRISHNVSPTLTPCWTDIHCSSQNYIYIYIIYIWRNIYIYIHIQKSIGSQHFYQWMTINTSIFNSNLYSMTTSNLRSSPGCWANIANYLCLNLGDLCSCDYLDYIWLCEILTIHDRGVTRDYFWLQEIQRIHNLGDIWTTSAYETPNDPRPGDYLGLSLWLREMLATHNLGITWTTSDYRKSWRSMTLGLPGLRMITGKCWHATYDDYSPITWNLGIPTSWDHLELRMIK